MKTGINEFYKNLKQRIASYGKNKKLLEKSKSFFIESIKEGYSYNFNWLGRPIIQYPQDIVAIQEIIWKTKPDIIVETGIAHGGSLVLSASILELLGGERFVIGIDIDIRPHNRRAIDDHPMSKRIKMVQGSSVDKSIVEEVLSMIPNGKSVMVILDSNHTHDHVANELIAYAQLVSKGNYLIVFDTIIEDIADEFEWEGRPWGKGNNPKTAVREFLENNDQFEVDMEYENKLLITVAPEGYLKRIK